MREVVLGALIVAATVLVLLGGPSTANPADSRSALRHPGTWLLIVTAFIYVNQLLFTIYVIREWNGDVSVIARYLPQGWFALADTKQPILLLAKHFPHTELLSWSVLRVQASLELPFVVLAYLTVCRWFSREVYQQALRRAWPVSIAYTATFCLIEWSLPNPYTTDDIVIRLIAAFLVPLGISRLDGPSRDHVRSTKSLVCFVISVIALGNLVLIVYDTALLYNLGHLGKQIPFAAFSVAALVAARRVADRTSKHPPGPGIDTVTRSLGWFMALFFVPALAIRYGFTFGTPIIAATAGVIITIAAIIRGAQETLRYSGVTRKVLLTRIAVAAGAGLAAALCAFTTIAGSMEIRLLDAASAFFAIVIIVCTLGDRETARP